MTETTVKKTCDVCGEKMVKDGPIWYGGNVTIEENYATTNSYQQEKVTVDVCRECLKKVRQILKVPQLDCFPLPQEMQDAVDRAVASMAREASRGRP